MMGTNENSSSLSSIHYRVSGWFVVTITGKPASETVNMAELPAIMIDLRL